MWLWLRKVDTYLSIVGFHPDNISEAWYSWVSPWEHRGRGWQMLQCNCTPFMPRTSFPKAVFGKLTWLNFSSTCHKGWIIVATWRGRIYLFAILSTIKISTLNISTVYLVHTVTCTLSIWQGTCLIKRELCNVYWDSSGLKVGIRKPCLEEAVLWPVYLYK